MDVNWRYQKVSKTDVRETLFFNAHQSPVVGMNEQQHVHVRWKKTGSLLGHNVSGSTKHPFRRGRCCYDRMNLNKSLRFTLVAINYILYYYLLSDLR